MNYRSYLDLCDFFLGVSDGGPWLYPTDTMDETFAFSYAIDDVDIYSFRIGDWRLEL